MAPQVGPGSEHGVDNFRSYWFYGNASHGFGQKCLLWTADLLQRDRFIPDRNIGLLTRAGSYEGSFLLNGVIWRQRKTGMRKTAAENRSVDRAG